MSHPPFPGGQQSSEWTKFLAGFVYAFRGLWYALHTQRNAKVHVTIAILTIAMGIALRISTVEFAIVFVAITGVFIAELFNTVFEMCVDLASPEYNPLAKVAKDMAAGGVLLSAMLSIVIGLLVLGPHVWAFLRK
jgi:diacylglycerol kinase